MNEHECQWLAKQIDELETRLQDYLSDDERDYVEQECKTYRQWLQKLDNEKGKS